MLKKVAVDKIEINKFVKIKKYKEAFEYINHIRKIIELVAKNRVSQLIENKVILEKEKEVFISLIENNINNTLLKDNNYILIDESYVETIEKRRLEFKSLKERRKLVRKI